MKKVKVYGADWCPLTKGSIHHLKQLGVAFEYIDVESDPKASEWVKRHNDGKERKPTIVIGDKILSEPTDEELDAALGA